MTAPGYFNEQLAAMRREIAAIRDSQVTHRSATVTAVDATSSTFTANVDGVGGVSGIRSEATSLPAIGEVVGLSLAGATPVYQPLPRSTVDTASGQQTSNVTDGGVASFQRVESVDDPVFQGVPLSKMVGQGAKMIAFGEIAQASYPGIGLGELGIMEIAFTAQPGRSYAIHFEGLNVAGIAGDDVVLSVRDGLTATPTVSHNRIAGPYYDQIIAGSAGNGRYHNYGFNGFLMGMGADDPAQQHRLLITLCRGAGGSGTLEVINSTVPGSGPICIIYDIGPSVINTGVINLGGAPPVGGTTVVQRYDEWFDASWSETYDGAGNADSGPELIQGYTSYYPARGNARGLIGFPDMTGRLAGVPDGSIEKIEISLYANHWNYMNGGTASLGWHGNASAPGTFNGTPNQFDWSNWGRNQRVNIDVTNLAGMKAGWRDGTRQGFTVGPGPSTDPIYYGRFNGAGMAEPPRLHLVYYK